MKSRKQLLRLPIGLPITMIGLSLISGCADIIEKSQKPTSSLQLKCSDTGVEPGAAVIKDLPAENVLFNAEIAVNQDHFAKSTKAVGRLDFYDGKDGKGITKHPALLVPSATAYEGVALKEIGPDFKMAIAHLGGAAQALLDFDDEMSLELDGEEQETPAPEKDEEDKEDKKEDENEGKPKEQEPAKDPAKEEPKTPQQQEPGKEPAKEESKAPPAKKVSPTRAQLLSTAQKLVNGEAVEEDGGVTVITLKMDPSKLTAAYSGEESIGDLSGAHWPKIGSTRLEGVAMQTKGVKPMEAVAGKLQGGNISMPGDLISSDMPKELDDCNTRLNIDISKDYSFLWKNDVAPASAPAGREMGIMLKVDGGASWTCQVADDSNYAAKAALFSQFDSKGKATAALVAEGETKTGTLVYIRRYAYVVDGNLILTKRESTCPVLLSNPKKEEAKK